MNFVKTLSRNEMKNVLAGQDQVPGEDEPKNCRVYSESTGWTACTTKSNAQQLYQTGEGGVTGYCCASCASEYGVAQCY